MAASIASLVSDLRTLGVEPGGVLLTHVGFRALGLVENVIHFGLVIVRNYIKRKICHTSILVRISCYNKASSRD